MHLRESVEDLAPEDALEKLLAEHSMDFEDWGNLSFKKEADLRAEQDAAELRFRQEIIEGDMFATLENNPSSYFNLKALFSTLQSSRSSEELFVLA
ncbi:hypothetical protein A2U01_0062715, partial [Trifolium medium]|nr:hypothetical protein [Trifolium medium]